MEITGQNRRRRPSQLVDWTSLPAELLNLISKKLPEIPDFIRFRAVCTRWLSAAPLSDPPSQLPWLLSYGMREHHHPFIRCYSLSSNKTHTLQPHHVPCMLFTGPCYGYMLKCDREKSDVSLINPLTNKEIHLPSLDCSIQCPVYVDRDPVQSREYVAVMGASKKEFVFAFCKPGDDQWTAIHDRSDMSSNVCYKGMYVMNDLETKATKVIDLSTQSVKYVIPAPIPGEKEVSSALKRTILVESSGEVLRVSWRRVRAFGHKDTGLKRAEKYYFDVYRLDFGKGDPCWVKTNNIGDQILFLDSRSGISVRASDSAGFRGNCIYFLERTAKIGGDHMPFYNLCRCDIKEGTEEVLPLPIENRAIWFMPSLC